MSWRDHEYDHGTYMPRRCRRPDEAAEAIQKHLAAVERERDSYRKALWTYFVAADWYRRCLEDVQDRRPVRGLDEAKQAFISADFMVRDLLGEGAA